MGRKRTATGPAPPGTTQDTTAGAKSLPKDAMTPQELSLSEKMDKVLAAIEHSRVSIEERLGSITTDITLIRDDHRKLAEKVSEGEKALISMQPAVKTHKDYSDPLGAHVDHGGAYGRPRRALETMQHPGPGSPGGD